MIAPVMHEAPVVDPAFEVRVTITVAIPYAEGRPHIRDDMERVVAALRQEQVLPDGSYVRSLEARYRTAKEIRSDNKKAAKRRGAL